MMNKNIKDAIARYSINYICEKTLLKPHTVSFLKAGIVKKDIYIDIINDFIKREAEELSKYLQQIK